MYKKKLLSILILSVIVTSIFFITGCVKQEAFNDFCVFDKKYEFKKEYKMNFPCSCTGTWIRYESCPGPMVEVNKYVPIVNYVVCNKMTEINKDVKNVNGVINVNFKEISYLQATNIIKKYGGKLIRINSRECAWKYGEVGHKTYSKDNHSMQVKVKNGKEKYFIENIRKEPLVKYAGQKAFDERGGFEEAY